MEIESAAVLLDVREDLDRGDEPFGKIMAAVGALLPGQELVLVNWFEPRPLYDVLARRGFGHAAEQLPDGCWRITFRRAGAEERGR